MNHYNKDRDNIALILIGMPGCGKPFTQKRTDPFPCAVRIGQNNDPSPLIGGLDLTNQLPGQGKPAGDQAIRFDTAPNGRYIALAFDYDNLLNQSPISLV